MLSEELVELDPINMYENLSCDRIFFGFKINNRYDEARVSIQSSFKPSYYKINNHKYYGITLEPTYKHKDLLKAIKNKKKFDVIGYSGLLEKFNLTCNRCFYSLQPPIYPIDSENITTYLPDFKYENFIFLTNKIPKFQQFSSVNMFLVTGP